MKAKRTAACADLVSFADAELDDERADAFRDHLPDCETCREELVEAAQLRARLSDLGPPPRRDPPPSMGDARAFFWLLGRGLVGLGRLVRAAGGDLLVIARVCWRDAEGKIRRR